MLGQCWRETHNRLMTIITCLQPIEKRVCIINKFHLYVYPHTQQNEPLTLQLIPDLEIMNIHSS